MDTETSIVVLLGESTNGDALSEARPLLVGWGRDRVDVPASAISNRVVGRHKSGEAEVRKVCR